MNSLKNIEYWLKSTSLGKFVKRFKTKKKSKVAKDYSYLADEILEKISNLKQPVSPMFGTLLSIIRDGKFNYADDYDFAIYDKKFFNADLITSMKNMGFNLKGFSLTGEQLVELTFLYKGVGIDIFLIENNGDFSIHKCPNFRLEAPQKDYANKMRRRKYSSYFIVKYPKIELTRSDETGLLMPNSPEQIFSIHYGSDWRTPKKDNFIDFSNYEFVEKTAMTCSGDSTQVARHIENKGYLSS